VRGTGATYYRAWGDRALLRLPIRYYRYSRHSRTVTCLRWGGRHSSLAAVGSLNRQCLFDILCATLAPRHGHAQTAHAQVRCAGGHGRCGFGYPSASGLAQPSQAHASPSVSNQARCSAAGRREGRDRRRREENLWEEEEGESGRWAWAAGPCGEGYCEGCTHACWRLYVLPRLPVCPA